MTRRRSLTLALVTVLLGAALVTASVAAVHRTADPFSQVNITCNSPALGGTLPAAVYLPSGYSSTTTVYPVIYFLHGLPAGPSLYQDSAFVAQAVANSGHPAIVVAPQGARTANSDREYLDWGPQEDWPRAIYHDLTSCVDGQFRTIATRSGRALIGLSAGGFGAFNIGLRHLLQFGAVESWSGYFAATDPSGWHLLSFRSGGAAAAARLPTARTLARRLGGVPTYVGFFVGDSDSRFLSWNTTLNRAMDSAHIRHQFAVYPGGHDQSLWVQEAPLWLGRALVHLSAPQTPPATGGVPPPA